MVGIDFYEMSHQILGELPETSLYLYDLVTIILIIFAFFILILPIALILHKGRRI